MGQTASSLRPLKLSPAMYEPSETRIPNSPRWEGTLAEVVTENMMPPPPRPLNPSRSVSEDPRSASPAAGASSSGRRSPYQLPLRSATAPVLQRTPSDDLVLPQDSAFPKFPTSRPQSPAPSTPVTNALPRFVQEQRAEIVDPESDLRQDMPRNVEGISPGPPHVRNGTASRPLRHHRKSSSITSSRDFTRSSGASSKKPQVRRPSTSSSIYTRNPSMISMPASSRITSNSSDVPALPSIPSNVDLGKKESRRNSMNNSPGFDFGTFGGQSSQQFSQQITQESENSHIGKGSKPKHSGHRPQASVASIMAPLHEIGSTSSFKPSKSIRRQRAATLTAPREGSQAGPMGDMKAGEAHPPMPSPTVMHNYEIGNPYHLSRESTSSNESSHSDIKSGSSRSSPPLNESPKISNAQTGPTPIGTGLRGFQFGVNEHIRGDRPEACQLDRAQQPSNDIEPFGQAHSALDPKPPPHLDSRPINPLNSGGPKSAPVHSTQGSSWGKPISQSRKHAREHFRQESRPGTPRSREPTPKPLDGNFGAPLVHGLKPFPRVQPSPPRSPQPPLTIRRPSQPETCEVPQAPQRRDTSPLTSPEDYIATSFPDQPNNNLHLTAGFPLPPAIPGSTSPAPRRAPVSKGPCRGCNETIYGKSVSSADGRLTGRYHKQCFVCTTCKAPFQTVDFYVCNNSPYCARHYHEINNSICGSCDRGIEGHYLEMMEDPRQRKFHPHCFTCQDCHLILRDDYYEWNGRVLCEQHAFGAASRSMSLPSSLVPGRRYPEKRSTRLMMM